MSREANEDGLAPSPALEMRGSSGAMPDVSRQLTIDAADQPPMIAVDAKIAFPCGSEEEDEGFEGSGGEEGSNPSRSISFHGASQRSGWQNARLESLSNKDATRSGAYSERRIGASQSLEAPSFITTVLLLGSSTRVFGR